MLQFHSKIERKTHSNKLLKRIIPRKYVDVYIWINNCFTLKWRKYQQYTFDKA